MTAEPHGRLARGGERDDPAGLAVAGQPDAVAVDLRTGGEEAHRGVRVAGEHVDGRRIGRLARIAAAGLADSTLVVGEDGDAVVKEKRLQVGEIGPRRPSGAVHPRDGRMRPGARRHGQRSRESDAAAAEAHLQLAEREPREGAVLDDRRARAEARRAVGGRTGRPSGADGEPAPGGIEAVDFTGVEVEETGGAVGIVDDREGATIAGIDAGRRERRRPSAPRLEGSADRSLPHGSTNAAARKPAGEDERRGRARQPERDLSLRGRDRDGLQAGVSDAESDIGPVAGDVECDLSGAAERVGPCPGARERRSQ